MVSAPAAMSAWVGTATPAAATSADVPARALVRLQGTDLCLTARASSAGVARCDGSTLQHWSIPADGSLRAVVDGRTVCLAVGGSSGEGASAAGVVRCSEEPVTADAERWSLVTAGDSTRFVPVLDVSLRTAPTRCLDAPRGATVAVVACTDASRARWQVLPVQSAPVATP